MMATNPSRLFSVACCVSSLALSSLSPAADPPASIHAEVSRVRPAQNIRARQALLLNIPTINIDGRSLSQVMDYLHELSGANLVVNWKILDSVNVKPETPITLQLTNVPFRKVLRLVLDQASPQATLVFPAEDNVITITTQAEADKVLYTRVYTIEDLIMGDANQVELPSFSLSAISTDTTTMASSTSAGGGGGGGGGGLFTGGNTTTTNQQNLAQKRGEDLVALVKEVVRPEVWIENGGTSAIHYYSGRLIVTAPASVLEEIGGPPLP